MGSGYLFHLGDLVGFDESGRWVVSLLIKAKSLFGAKCRGVGVVINAIDFPLCLRNFFGKLL